VDLDVATMRLGMKWLGLKTEIEVSESYVESRESRVVSRESIGAHSRITAHDSLLDLRSTFQPKKPLPPEVDAVPPYPQVFADRHGFVGRLSVVDLVCNCGPEARSILSMQKA